MTFLKNLQSPETDTILNTIDELRSQGIGDILELPQIIVCGDQSSGKSSVLNAVSTLNFPTKDALCTRFATEVIMRPRTSDQITVSIVSGYDRTPTEKLRLAGFTRKKVSMEDIANLIEEATELMGIRPHDPGARRFSNDILRFEVTGPNQPSLTLVDLPGLFQVPSKDQTDEDTKAVQELVLKYMKNKRSVILAVISAKSDFVLQTVTKYSRQVDEHGLRTLGIITKPDKLDANSESEKKFMELAENQLSHLHRGWHVLVNRDYTTRTFTQDERDQFEEEFLSNGVWARLPRNHKGVFSLRSRLSGLLRDQILDGLPGLIEDTEKEIEKHKTKLCQLGMSRATPDDRRRYLTQASQIFSVVMRSCVNGPYDNKFFNSTTDDKEQLKRLRAFVQNSLLAFTEDMKHRGHAKHIIDDQDSERAKLHPHRVVQNDYEDEVMDLMRQNRGRELTGTFDPLIIRELFVAQSKPWTELLERYQKRIFNAAKATTDLVLGYSTDEVTMTRLKEFIVDPALDALRVALSKMVQNLLTLHKEKHPMTYNLRLAEFVSKAKQAHAEKIFAEKFEEAVNTPGEVVSKSTLNWLFKQHSNVEPESLERYSASEAIDITRAYYKISRETIVDNFGLLAIEDCLISRLPDLLSPEKIADLDDETIESIAMETDVAAADRVDAEERLESSSAALLKLMQIEQRRRPAPIIGSMAVRSELAVRERPNDNDGVHQLQERIKTEISALDPGISDYEDQQTISTGYVDANDFAEAINKKEVSVPEREEAQTVSTEPVNEGDPLPSKKKRMKVRDRWMQNSVAEDEDRY